MIRERFFIREEEYPAVFFHTDPVFRAPGVVSFAHGERITGIVERRALIVKLQKILNSGWGIALAVLAFLVAGRTVSLISWSLLRMCGYAVLGGILVLVLFRNRK